MNGSISSTHLSGGMIRRDRSDLPLLPFGWRDCDFLPNDVGHDTAVKFYIEVVNGRERAIAVRL